MTYYVKQCEKAAAQKDVPFDASKSELKHHEDQLRAEALALFARADRNNDGALSRSELKKDMKHDTALREKLSATQWRVFFNEIDSNGKPVTHSYKIG